MLSTGIGGFNVNYNWNWFKGGARNFSPISWRGAWTPLVFGSQEINAANKKSAQLAEHINTFLQDEEI